MKTVFLSLALMLAAVVSAQVPFLGEWITIDDESGEKKSVVNIYKADNGMYYGQIVTLFENPDALCTECKDADYNQPIVGLTIVRDMQLVEGELRGGKVLDPAKGKLYYAKIYLEDGKLILRGSLDKRGLLGRSQTWIRK
jgi:uncharacterized protein (DUF2147 family)